MTQPSNVIGPDDDESPRTGLAAMRHRDFLLLLLLRLALRFLQVTSPIGMSEESSSPYAQH